MRALRKLGPGRDQLVVREIARPTPGPGEILIRVAGAGICGTDLHIRQDRFPKVRPPVTLGHEFAGEIAELGPEVDGWRLGDRVTIESEAFACGGCPHCAAGLTNLCPDRLAYGYSADGGFAEYVAVRGSAAHLLPDHVSLQEGALGEPLAVGVHAVLEVARVEPGEVCLVTGVGPIGLICALVARSAGAEVILAGLSSDRERLAVAAEAGLENLVESDRQDLVRVVREVGQGALADVALECSGAAPAVGDCLTLLKPQARLIQVGLFEEPVPIDLTALALREIRLWGSFAHHPQSWRTAVGLWADKKVDLTPLISGVYDLDDWSEPFDLADQGRGIKYLLKA